MCPSAYNYLRFAYSVETPLFHQGATIKSQTGTQQGCPLGPLGFALGIHGVVTALASHRLLLNTWYLDDGILVGDGPAVGAAFACLGEAFKRVGPTVNSAKCRLWGPGALAASMNGCSSVPPTPWVAGSGVTVLGIPVDFPGCTSVLQEAWRKGCEDLRECTSVVTQHLDPQCAHHVLRYCLDGCKLNHLLRGADPYQVSPLVAEATDVIASAFSDIIGCGLDAARRLQVGSPFHSGGCGLKLPAMQRPAARIAALLTFAMDGQALLGLPDYASTIPPPPLCGSTAR